MTKDDLQIKAYEIALAAHEGQTRWGGEPYISHPLAVSKMVMTPEEKVVALLHDVVEDTDVTLEDLEQHGFGDRIIRAVDALTHREGEEYYHYIERLSGNDIAIEVKLADLRHNLSDLDAKKHKGMINKYKLAELFLMERRHYLMGTGPFG